MAEQDTVSFNVRLFFAGDNKFIIPLSVGDLPLGMEGTIDAIKGYRKIKLRNNIREIGECEFVLPIGQEGQNDEFDYVYDLAGTVRKQDIYYQFIDIEENVHVAWLLKDASVIRTTLMGTDHASKAQTRMQFKMLPTDIKRDK